MPAVQGQAAQPDRLPVAVRPIGWVLEHPAVGEAAQRQPALPLDLAGAQTVGAVAHPRWPTGHAEFSDRSVAKSPRRHEQPARGERELSGGDLGEACGAQFVLPLVLGEQPPLHELPVVIGDHRAESALAFVA